ncbi:hypothetical protein Afil01_31920 [Actinorhabdospora filicis]|uniref:Uncharacterized protein n=1 Tax=Actinorhabdospora filicis TaxID=1785913 RepID=A0A9W6SJW4_9ACTN|nr:hypothetical protein [Actinorhabdospora filicis]GLZ78385.1 hypothetical protein Afil01_31920 [Actinorhabdospora filicis]
MSFGAFARHVRNPALPHGRRVSALRSCVQLYRPVGYHAGLGFLREVAGPYESDEAALLRALDALSASRAGWHAEIAEYAVRRRDAKRRGQRSPRPGEPNPYHGPRHWYGAPRQAALFALTLWRPERPPGIPAWLEAITARVDSCVAACLESGGPLTPAQRDDLADAVDALQRRIRADLWYEDQSAYFRARDLLTVTGHVQTAAAQPR